MQNLVIVESPTKARTLQRFLGKSYQIEASMGHIRDLPKSEFGVDTKTFEPKYIIPKLKKKKANELKKLAGNAKTIWLASDPDREGEAIAWHIVQLTIDKGQLTKKKMSNVKSQMPNFKRVVFHEITPEAIKEAFNHPRDIDLKLVDAQQARRVLDRLVGYKLSPLLWQKVKRGLSAGRVQSVALRLIVERQREIEAFKPEEYWIIQAELSSGETFLATLVELNGKKLAIKNEKEAKEHVGNLEKAKYRVLKVTKRLVKRNPYPPFTTSTLQQAASNRLGFSAKKTMTLAQNLYEHGLITYMRTDSVNLAPSAISAARDYISLGYGKDYLPHNPKYYKSKSKNAQEAHEAIRPTKADLLSSHVKDENGLVRDHARLYDLIWKRFVACQMNEALVDQTSVDIKADNYTLRANGSVIKFDGWLRLYDKGTGDSEQVTGEDKEKVLPELEEDEDLKLEQLLRAQHFTEPPAAFTEASLIKRLEELGIGRPSTYAPILSTIIERFYVERIDRKFIPTSLGLTVTDFLVKYFSDIVNYSFTAQMEDELDEIARGERAWKPTMKAFYVPFEKKLEETQGSAQKIMMESEKVDKVCPLCGKGLLVRYGKFGKFLACSGFPECKHTEAFEDVSGVKCPTDGGDIVIRHTKSGKIFYGCKNWPDCKFASWTKPKSMVS